MKFNAKNILNRMHILTCISNMQMKLIINNLHCSNSDKVNEFHCHQQGISLELAVPKSNTTVIIQQILSFILFFAYCNIYLKLQFRFSFQNSFYQLFWTIWYRKRHKITPKIMNFMSNIFNVYFFYYISDKKKL